MSTGSQARLAALDGSLDAIDVGPQTSAELFAVVDVLDGSATLRRALTDPSTPEQVRQGLVRRLFDGKVSGGVIEVVAQAAAMRWSGGRTFAQALERQAVRAQLIDADRNGQLEETEDELFRFARLVESTPDLRNALADRVVPVSGRQELVGDLLGGRATGATSALARRAVKARERTFAHTIEGYVNAAAAHKNRVVATVRVARPLTDEQRERLRTALARQTGREVAIQVIVEQDLIGGVRVEIGNEVIEGTVAGRLAEARRLFS